MAENNILQGIEVNGTQYSFPEVTKDTAIGSTPSTTNVPTSAAVASYVAANQPSVPTVEQTLTPTETSKVPSSKAVADYVGIDKSETTSITEEQTWSNDDGTDFWVKIGSYGIKAKSFFTLDGSKIGIPVIVVDKNGHGDYTTVQSAINATSNGDTIYVMPGIYKEHVDMYNKERHLIGISKESVIIETHSGLRSDNPCNANVGSIENITFIAYIDEAPEDYESRPNIDRSTYPIHIDTKYQKDGAISTDRHTITVSNCRCISYAHAAIGIGVRYNQTINVIDCELITYNTTAGGFLMHNDDFYPNSEGARINVHNCYIQGVSKALTISSLNNNALCELQFTNNNCIIISDGTESVTNISPTQENHKWGNDISNSILSHGNNINELNY